MADKKEYNKFGLQYAREKADKLQKENVTLQKEVDRLDTRCLKLMEKNKNLEREHEKEIFKRMVNGVSVLTGWEL